MGSSDDATDPAKVDAEAFLSDEELIKFFAKQRGITVEDARARLKEILEAVGTQEKR
jgi:ABC-type multidrug transport system ATPase subunit